MLAVANGRRTVFDAVVEVMNHMLSESEVTRGRHLAFAAFFTLVCRLERESPCFAMLCHALSSFCMLRPTTTASVQLPRSQSQG